MKERREGKVCTGEWFEVREEGRKKKGKEGRVKERKEAKKERLKDRGRSVLKAASEWIRK